jgi:predicted PurR-regulated permease PerM
LSKNKVSAIFSNKRPRNIMFLCMWVALALMIFFIRDILTPFILASLLTYVFEPAVNRICLIKFKNIYVPRWASVLFIYLIIGCAIVLLGAFFLPEFYREMIRLTKEATSAVNSIDENTVRNIAQEVDNFFRRNHLPVELVAPIGSKEPVTTHPNWISIDLVRASQNILNDIVLLKPKLKILFLAYNTY